MVERRVWSRVVRPPRALVALGVLAAIILSGCGRTPGPPEAPGSAPAHVTEFEVEFVGSGPVEHVLRVDSISASACGETFDRIDVERDSTTFVVTVWNTVIPPPEEACPSVGRLDQHEVVLGRDLEAGVEYTVRVNSAERTFVAR